MKFSPLSKTGIQEEAEEDDEPETPKFDEEVEVQEEQEETQLDKTSDEDKGVEDQEEQEELQEDEQGLEGCLNEAGNNIHNLLKRILYFL